MSRVSIGIPVYNGEQFVAHAIQSVLDQSYQDWELIISDNASTDGTQAICESFAELDPRIKYFRATENHGAAWNFNEVFHKASGELFRWLSHDDYLMPTVIEKCVEALDQNPDCVGCATATGAIDEDGYRILDDLAGEVDLHCQGLTEASERRRLEYSRIDDPADRYLGILIYSRRCNEIYGLMRRSQMAQSQLHPTYCGGDKVLLAELAMMGKIHELPELLFYVRWHDTRFTSNSSTKEQDEHMSTEKKSAFALPHQYRSTFGYLGLIRRRKLSFGQRAKCLLYWLRFTFQVSKWTAILKNTLSGKATWAELTGKTKRGERIHGAQSAAQKTMKQLQSV